MGLLISHLFSKQNSEYWTIIFPYWMSAMALPTSCLRVKSVLGRSLCTHTCNYLKFIAQWLNKACILICPKTRGRIRWLYFCATMFLGGQTLDSTLIWSHLLSAEAAQPSSIFSSFSLSEFPVWQKAFCKWIHLCSCVSRGVLLHQPLSGKLALHCCYLGAWHRAASGMAKDLLLMSIPLLWENELLPSKIHMLHS